MKKIILVLTILTSFIFTGCSKNSEVNAFISDSDKLANDIVQKIMADPNASGIDDAQRALDGKKADMKAKYESLKSVRGFQVSGDTMKRLTDSTTKNVKTINELKFGFAGRIATDKPFGEKMNKLISDYNALYIS